MCLLRSRPARQRLQGAQGAAQSSRAGATGWAAHRGLVGLCVWLCGCVCVCVGGGIAGDCSWTACAGSRQRLPLRCCNHHGIMGSWSEVVLAGRLLLAPLRSASCVHCCRAVTYRQGSQLGKHPVVLHGARRGAGCDLLRPGSERRKLPAAAPKTCVSETPPELHYLMGTEARKSIPMLFRPLSLNAIKFQGRY